MGRDHAERLWRIAPQIAGALGLIGTLVGALAHSKFEVWDVAFYLGMAVMLGLIAAIPAAVLAAAVTSAVDDADEEITWIACMLLLGAILTALGAGVFGPDETDTFGRVAFSAIGLGGLGYAFYKRDEVKTKESQAAEHASAGPLPR